MDSEARILTVASSECDGKPLRAPNDITLDGPRRVLFHGYFTDPGGSREAPIGTLHYVDGNGKTSLGQGGMSVPNGLVIDPAGKYLYVAETVPDRILRFPILGPGKLGTLKIFADLPRREGHDATPDGLTVDGGHGGQPVRSAPRNGPDAGLQPERRTGDGLLRRELRSEPAHRDRQRRVPAHYDPPVAVRMLTAGASFDTILIPLHPFT